MDTGTVNKYVSQLHVTEEPVTKRDSQERLI